MALHEAGKEKAREISQDRQDSRAECMERVKEAAAKAMGKRKEDLTDMDVEKLNMEGTKEAAKAAAVACYETKKVIASATCEDPFEKFMETRKMERLRQCRKG